MLQGGLSPAGAFGLVAPTSIAKVYDIAGPWDFSSPAVEGDFGVFTPDPTTGQSGQPVVMRYKEAVPWNGFDPGSTPMWLPVDVYENNPRIRGFFTGSEPSTAQIIFNQNIGIATGNGGSAALTGGYLQLDAPSVADSFARIQTSQITGAEDFYITCEIMADITQVSSGDATAVFTQPGTTQANTQYSFGVRSGFGTIFQNWYWDNATSAYVAVTLNSPTIRSTIANPTWPTISTGTPCFHQAISGKDIDDIVSTRIDGATQSTWRRAADGATTASVMDLRLEATGSLSAPQSGAADIRIRNFFFILWG
jgi:hypothetical protein